jgi:hypothetical protein
MSDNITKKVRPKVVGHETRRQRPKPNKPILFDKANDQHSQILIDWFKTHTEIIENLESYKDVKTGVYDKTELRRKSLKLDNPLKMRIAKDTNIALPLNIQTLNYLFNLYDPDKVFMIPIKGKNRDYNSHIGYYFINNEKGLQGWVLKKTLVSKSKTNDLSLSSEIGSSSSSSSDLSSSDSLPKPAPKPTPKPAPKPTPKPTPKPASDTPQGPASPGKINLYDTERAEHEEYTKSHTPQFLYPSLNNPHFAQEIANKKEFTDTRYDGKIHNIEEYADILCNTKFELAPHQLFVKNFLSNETPYNSLLLFHGLGTGKTCSAIGIAEESRIFMKQIGLTKSIFVVATPNVQQNFRIQLFDPRKLQSENGVWNINACVGNSLLKEINPMNMRGLTKEKAIALIQAIINQYYVFMGYVEFANYIQARIRISADVSETEREKKERALIQQFFNNRLVIIDEVHNIRLTDDNKNKRTTNLLMKVAKYSQNMKLVVLSATPMYNSYTEIIWLLNLLNTNDKRDTIQIDQVFDADGEFRENIGTKKGRKGATSTENGRDLLMRKLIGYVSYVRGENPYNFPYRIYPLDFDKTRAILTVASPPIRQLNGNPIPQEHQKRKLPLYTNVVKSDSYQYRVYDKLIHGKKMGNIQNMDSFGYTMLQAPIEALNIVYPDEDFMGASETAAIDALLPTMIGKAGLDRITTSTVLKNPFIRTNFAYKPEILKKYGRIFQRENIKNYSAKISSICQTVLSSDGIILIYSQYIDGGVVPIALALEEMGFAKYGSPTEGGQPAKSLFKTPPTEPLDALARIPRSRMKPGHIFYPAKYVMITGDITYSPNNAEDIKAITNTSNKDGREIKVVLISKAGSEGLDFKWIRQVHVLEPWYNMNRIEQIIGRGVRNMSHCGIPFIERNVEIYLHCTIFEEGGRGSSGGQTGSSRSSSVSQTNNPVGQTEAVDLYVYRLAEKKAMQIGKITRLLKQTAIDCLLNIEQTNFTEEKLFEELNNQNIRLRLSSQTELLPFKIGDKRESYTDVCDYMDNCNFVCLPDAREKTSQQPNYMTYNEKYVNTTKEQIIDRIRQLFKERAFYSEKALIQHINIVKKYPLEQIYHTLTYLIGNQNEYLTDKYDRQGYLIEKAGLATDGKTENQYYAFQPIEITDLDASVYERTMPVDYKRRSLNLELNPNPEIRPIERQISEFTRRDQTGDFGDATGAAAEAGFDPNVVSETANVIQDNSVFANEIYEDMIRCIHSANTEKPSKEMKVDWFYNLKFGDEKPGAGAQKREKKSLKTLLTNIHGITAEEIDFYAMRHYMDTLTIDKKLVLLSEYLQPTVVSDAVSATSIPNQINNYFHERLLVIPSMTAIFFANENSYVILKQSKTNPREWSKISPEDNFKLIVPLKKLTVPVKNVNRFVGFMHPFKGSGVVFKVKDTTQKNNKNNKGVKCDIMSKPRIIEKINHILGEDLYQSRGVQLENIDKIQLCIILEILMRHLTRTDPPNVRFYDAESAILNGVVDI